MLQFVLRQIVPSTPWDTGRGYLLLFLVFVYTSAAACCKYFGDPIYHAGCTWLGTWATDEVTVDRREEEKMDERETLMTTIILSGEAGL